MSKGRITKEQLSDSLLNFITQNAGSAGGPATIEFKKNSVTVESSVTQVAIGISGFDKSTDLLMVYKNSVYLEENVIYTISSDSLYIEKIEGSWNESGTSVFNFVVIKGGATGTGSSSVTIADGTITKAKLALELQNKITEIDILKQKDTELSSQLEQIDFKKMNNGDSISITQIDKNKGKFDETYFTDEFLSKITENTTIADKSITREKLANKSIYTENLSEEIFNLVNGYEIKGNKIKWQIGSIDEFGNNIIISPNRIRSEFILINEGIISLSNYVDYGINVVFYDFDFNRKDATQWITKDIVVKEPCYVKILIKKSNGSVITDEEIETISSILNIKNIPLAAKSIDKTRISEDFLEELNYTVANGISYNWEIGTLGAAGEPIDLSTRIRISDFIKINRGMVTLKDYSKYSLNVIFYNSDFSRKDATQWIKKDAIIKDCTYIKFMIAKSDNSIITEEEIIDIVSNLNVYYDSWSHIDSLTKEVKYLKEHLYDGRIRGNKYLADYEWVIGSVFDGVIKDKDDRFRSDYIKLKKGDVITCNDMDTYKFGGHIYTIENKTWILDIGWQNGAYVCDRDCYYIMVAGFKDNRKVTENDKINFIKTLDFESSDNIIIYNNILNIDINNINYVNANNYQTTDDSVIINSDTNEINYIQVDTITSNAQIAIIEVNAKLIDSSSKATISLFRNSTKALEVSIDTMHFKPYILKIPFETSGLFSVRIGSLSSTNTAKCEVKDIVIKLENIVKKQNSNDNLIYIAHRGDTKFAPENTFPAFMQAKLKGFNAIETDVEITSDGELVLLHDDSVDRTSDGSGTISTLTLNQVKELDFGSWKNTKYRGTTIPTLREFLEWCRMTDIRPVLELKRAFNTEQANKFINTLKETKMWDRSDVISFSLDALKSVSNIDNSCRFALIGNPSQTTINNLKSLGSNVYYSIYGGDLVAAVSLCNANNIDYIYSTNDGDTIRNCYKLGCFGICTDMLILNDCCM